MVSAFSNVPFHHFTDAFRASPEEEQQLERLVQLTGLTKQEYIISRLLGRDIVVQGNLRVYQALKENLAAVLSELKRICPGEIVSDDLLDTIHFISSILQGMKQTE